MKQFLHMIIIIGVFFGLLGTVGATNIVEFNFNNGTKTGAITNNTTFISNPYTADNGIIGNINTSIISLAGGSIFSTWVAGADGALASAPNFTTRSGGNNTKYWMINFSTLGYSGLQLFSKQQSSNTGPRDFRVEYSTNNIDWFTVPDSTITVANNFTSGVLSGITLPNNLNNQPMVYLRWIMTSNTSVSAATVSNAGTHRIDDVKILGVPFYTASYTAGINGTLSGNTNQTIDEGSNSSAVLAIPHTGYSFVNRSDGSTDNPRTDTSITGNISITANFIINQYLVIFQDYNSAVLSTGLINYGNSATAPFIPSRTGHSFSGWDLDFSTITGNTLITAQYTINQYTISFDTNGGSAISPIIANYNSNFNVINPSRSGYNFVGWSPALPSTIPAQNTSFVAQWDIINIPTPTTGDAPTQGGGGGNSLTKDHCPNGDYTNSYYDHQCGSKASTIDNILSSYNENIKDGYCYSRRNTLSLLDSEIINTNEEFKQALLFMYNYQITSFKSIDRFDPYRDITREEAAKIFSNFAMNVLCRKPDTSLQPSYVDTYNANDTLKPYITKAYQLGLMKGGTANNFRPFDTITKAEFNAVLIRMILNGFLSEDSTNRYDEYNKVSTELGIITQGAGPRHLSRYDASLMLFRAYKNQSFALHTDQSYTLKNYTQYVK